MDKSVQSDAVLILTYYLRTVWEKAGLPWVKENDEEVERIVHLIVISSERATLHSLQGCLRRVGNIAEEKCEKGT